MNEGRKIKRKIRLMRTLNWEMCPLISITAKIKYLTFFSRRKSEYRLKIKLKISIGIYV